MEENKQAAKEFFKFFVSNMDLIEEKLSVEELDKMQDEDDPATVNDAQVEKIFDQVYDLYLNNTPRA